MAKAKTANLCINIVASLSHVELLQYDAAKGAFEVTDSEEFMFDPATRELIDDEDRLKTNIKRLFERNKILFRTQTTLVLPSFFTRQYALPEDVLAEDIKPILISEAERFYIFKKVDPEIGYCAIKGDQVLYTAYPKMPLNLIHSVFNELKIPLASIDVNYTAILRGLVAMGVVHQEIENQLKWGILVISDFNVFMAVMEGTAIEKTLETPVPMQNTDEEILMSEIKEDFQQFFGLEILSKMVLVNNSLKLYSPTLGDKIDFHGPIEFFDQNDGTLASRGAKDAAFPCTLEAVGGALVNMVPEIPPLEMCDPDNIETFVDDKRLDTIAYGLIGVGVLLIALWWGTSTLLSTFTKGELQKSSTLQASISQTLSSLSIIPEVKQKLYVKEGTFQNDKVNNIIVEIFKALPPDTWLKTVSIKASSDFKTISLDIAGGAVNADPLNTYVKELDAQLKASEPLAPTVTPQQENSHRFFEFTLTNAKQGAH